MGDATINCVTPRTLKNQDGRVAKAESVTFTLEESVTNLADKFTKEQEDALGTSDSNTGTCEYGGKIHAWNHENDWWHNFPSFGEHQDGKHSDQAVQDPNSPPDGRVFCYMTPEGKAAIVWTEKSNPTTLVLGRIVAPNKTDASLYWHQLHHNLMNP